MSRVLLYSGGLDSYIAAYLWRPDVLLHVDLGTRYGAAEGERLAVPGGVTGRLEQATLDLSPWERTDAIIPLRNLHLVALASQYGDEVALGATAGDRVLDKTHRFAGLATDLLAYLWQPQHWTPGRDVRVVLPFKGWTKRDLVRGYIAAGGAPRALAADTLSCYSPTPDGGQCGGCKPCARKWVALAAEGIEPGYDAGAYVAHHYLPAIRAGAWDRGADEAAAVLAAAERKGLQ